MPERIPLTFNLPAANFIIPFTDTHVAVETAIFTSQVTVRLIVVAGIEPAIQEIGNAVEQYLQSSLDIIGYEMGFALRVDMVSAQRTGAHHWHVFGINIPMLAARSRFGRGGLPSELLAAIGSEPKAQMALADFREAMKVPAQTGFYCYRCIETIMQWYRQAGESKSDAWDRLRKDLNISQEVLRPIQAYAATARHGEFAGMSDEDRATCFKYTDEILYRFLRRLVRKFALDIPENFSALLALA